MKVDVFITSVSKFLPNSPVYNEDMERYLGLINEKPSRVKRIVLKQNGIRCRYYALDENQGITHTNAELAVLSIQELFPSSRPIAYFIILQAFFTKLQKTCKYFHAHLIQEQ